MGLVGYGVDIVHLPRIAALVTRRGADRFARRILSKTELKQWSSGARFDPVNFLATRFCLKEAAYKAMYPVRPTWKELSYTPFGYASLGSKPKLSYRPNVKPRPGWFKKLHVSVSHDGEYVVSIVQLEVR